MKSSITTIVIVTLNISIFGQINNRNCFDGNWKSRDYAIPSSTTNKDLTISQTSTARIEINVEDTIAPVLTTHYGVNTPFRNGSDQRSRIGLYDGIVSTLRFPAGSGSNTYFFDGKTPTSMEQYYDQQDVVSTVAPINGLSTNSMTPQTFISFKNDINGEAIVVVNYFYARYGITTAGTRDARVKQAADYAASFVKKLNIDYAGKVKYWEIGNEIYGKWEVGYNVNNPAIGTVTAKEYGEDCRVFINAMKAVDPTIKCGVVIETEDCPWNAGVMPEVQDHADFFIVHNYFTTVAGATSSALLGSVPQIKGVKDAIDLCISKYTNKPANYFPIAMTEFNARGAYNCSMVNGLFISQIIGEGISNKYGLVSLWVSEWAWDGTTKDCKGFLSVGDPEQSDYTARQAYVPYYYYNKCFGDYMVNSTSNNSSIKSYASVFNSKQVGLVLVNNSNTTQQVALTLKDNTKTIDFSMVHWYEFYANTIEPTVNGYKKFYINGQTSTTTGGGPDLTTVAPYQSSCSPNSVITMKPYSVIYMVVIKDPADIALLYKDGFELRNGYPSNFLVKKQNNWAVYNSPNNINPNTYSGIWFRDIYCNGLSTEKTYTVQTYPEERTGGSGLQCLKINVNDVNFGATNSNILRIRGLDNKISFNTLQGEDLNKYEVKLWARTDGATKPIFKTNTGNPILVSSTWSQYVIDKYVVGTSSTGFAIDLCPQDDNSNYALYIDDFEVKLKPKTTGISTINAGELTVYPNPATEFISINIHEKANEVTIYDIKGNIVLRNKLNGMNTLDIKELEKGIYFINVLTSGNEYRTRFIKK